MGQIYLIKINKKDGNSGWYVGQTKYTAKQRFQGHIYGDTLVDNKIREHGIENTELIVLHNDVQTQEELDRLEVFYIDYFKTFVGHNKGGYNKTLGGSGTRTTEIGREELQKAVDEGLSMTEMCKRFGNITNVTLTSWMRAYEIENKSLFQQHEATIRQMISEGKHLGEISAATGIQSSILSTELKAAGLKATRKHTVRTTPKMEEQVRTLTADGKSVYEIERLTGISRSNVQKIREKLGLKSSATSSVNKGATAVTPEIISKVEALRAEGHSHYQIARKIGYDRSTVTRILNGKYSHLIN